MIGLTPKQKQQLDSAVSFLSLGMLAIFAVVVTLFLLYEISNQPQEKNSQPDIVQKGNYISERDIAIEKSVLPVYEEFPDDFSTSTPKAAGDHAGEARIISSADFERLTKSSESIIYPDNFSYQELAITPQQENTNLADSADAQIFVDESSGLQVNAATINYSGVGNGEESSMQVRQGVVFSINRENNTMLISSLVDGNQLITLTPDTKYFINGKPIMFANLEETDVVHVEGFGYSGVKAITASSVSIIGNFEILTNSNE